MAPFTLGKHADEGIASEPKMSPAKASVIGIAAALPWLYAPTASVSAQSLGWLVSLAVAAVLVWAWQLQRTKQPPTRLKCQWRTSGVEIVIGAWLLAAISNAMIGIFQAAGLSSQANLLIAQASAMEAIGQMRQRNQLASLMAIGILSALYFLDVFKQRGTMTKSQLLGIVAGLFVCTTAMAMTASRTGLVQLILIFACMFAKRHADRAQSFFSVGILVLYITVSAAWSWVHRLMNTPFAGLGERLQATATDSRITLWSNVIDLIAQQPILGHGWRSLAYSHYSNAFEGERFMEMLDNAHNLPLHLAVELGLPMAFWFCAFVGWLIWMNKPWRERRPDRQFAWGVLMVIGVHSMVEYPLWYGPFFMTAVICTVILCKDAWREFDEKLLLAGKKYTHHAIVLGVRGGALLMLAFVAFAAFDYHRVSQIYLQPEGRSSWYAADPLGAARKSVLFQSHAKFAELQITPLSRETAPRVLELSNELVRWSPEPRIIEKLIESATMMQEEELALFHLKRYKAAYPAAYTRFTSVP